MASMIVTEYKRLFSGCEPTKRKGKRNGQRRFVSMGISSTQGKAVFDYACAHVGPQFCEEVLRNPKAVLPKYFWPSFMKQEAKREPSIALIKHYRKAFKQYTASLRKGAFTPYGFLGERSRAQKRKAGHEFHAVKCPELGALLYNWFIDCVQALRSRVDANLLMRQAELLRCQFKTKGLDVSKLPSFNGGSIKSWFFRWRKRYDIKYRKTVKHL